jgi:hypothetical protein
MNKLVIFRGKTRNFTFLFIYLDVLVSFSSNLIFEEHNSYSIKDKLNNKHGVIDNK